MATLERTVEIRARAEMVFDYVVAERECSMSFWQGGVYKWIPLSQGPMGNGFRVSYVARGHQTVEEFVRLEAARDLNHLRQIRAMLQQGQGS